MAHDLLLQLLDTEVETTAAALGEVMSGLQDLVTDFTQILDDSTLAIKEALLAGDHHQLLGSVFLILGLSTG